MLELLLKVKEYISINYIEKKEIFSELCSYSRSSRTSVSNIYDDIFEDDFEEASFNLDDYFEDLYYEERSLSSSKSSSINKSLNIKNKLFNVEETWQQALFKWIDDKELKDPDVYKRANISKQTFSKIRGDINYQPNKDTSIQLCIGLKLNIDDSLDLLRKAGYSLSNSIKRDLVVKYFIENRIYNIDELNLVLEELELKLFPIN